MIARSDVEAFAIEISERDVGGTDLSLRLTADDRQIDVTQECSGRCRDADDIRAAALKEMARVLKPDGLVVIVDSMQKGDEPSWDGLLDLFPHYFHEPYYADYVASRLETLAADAGLSPVAAERAFLSKVAVFTPIVVSTEAERSEA